MRSSISIPMDRETQHHWFLRVQPDCSEESLESFISLFREFVVLGNAGAFVVSDSDGTNCFMRIDREDRTERGVLELFVDVGHCDGRYARVLRNIAFGMGEIVRTPVLEFRVEPASLSPREEQLVAEVDAAEVKAKRFYPEISSRLMGQILFQQPPNYRSGRRVLLTAADELSVPLVEDLTFLVEKWGAVLVVAYPSTEDELREGQTMILNVEGSQHDEVAFEVLIDRFIASEAAFYSLLNLLVIRASQDTRVLKVIVE
jgi:hypothetical protein